MSDDDKSPSNADILRAVQGMWGQQRDLVQGVESRLGAKIERVESRLEAKIEGVEERLEARIDGVEERLEAKIGDTEKRLSERLAREIQDRPVVVHVDMGRVAQLEKQMLDLTKRLEEIEARLP